MSEKNTEKKSEPVDNSRRKVVGKLAYTVPTLISLGIVSEVHAQIGSPPCPPQNPNCP